MRWTIFLVKGFKKLICLSHFAADVQVFAYQIVAVIAQRRSCHSLTIVEVLKNLSVDVSRRSFGLTRSLRGIDTFFVCRTRSSTLQVEIVGLIKVTKVDNWQA